MIWKNQSIQMFSIISILATIVSSVSLPGVVPTDYTEGERVELHVNVLSSLKKSVLPFDYYYEQFHFCRPEEGAIQQTQSIGSMLFGDRLFNSPFELYMLKNQTCKKTCEAQIPADDAKFINQAIQETYLLSWMVDGLPAAQKSNTGMEHASIGFHLGQRIGRINPSTNEMEVMSLLNNHFEIYIQYHERKDKKYRVVGVFVNPTSTQFDTCDRKEKDMGMALSETDMNSVTYTYDVYWIPSEIEWGSRWDHYLYSTDNKIHWFSVINSLIVVLLLSAMVSGILLQALRRDIIRYNQVDFEDSQEQFGWKMVHGDVFRPPIHRMILSVLIGNGFQLLFMSVVTIVIAALGFLSPSNRGALATAMIILYFLFSCVSGYTSARVYKMCGGQRWRQNMLMTTLLVPGSLFGLLIVLNFLFIGSKSSAAIPFTTLSALLSLWFFLSIPLSLLGAFFGFRKSKIQVPVRTLQIPRQIPEQPVYLQLIPAVLLAGVLPFGALFIELLYILNSIWSNRIYYVFGFLMIVFVILILTTSLVSIIVIYFSLCTENYHWWWRSFMAGSCCGFYVFIYSIIYCVTKLELSDTSSIILYFGWTAVVSGGLGLMTGTASFVACLIFVRSIYSAIKID